MANVDVYLENVTVRFGKTIAVNDMLLEILKGELIALLGPSGCGKTTTLRAVAGLVNTDEGNIYISGKNVNDIPIEKRNTGIVFQNYALWPHLSVFENVAFGLEMAKRNKNEIKERVTWALDLLKLGGLESRFSHELSGGQQQRVALARAIVINPAVLLLDEPLGALDKKLREEMQIELKQLQRNLGITTIFVTHDQEEALTLADRIAVMNQGIIEQLGTPESIYETPQNRFVANFIGISSFLEGRLMEQKENMVTCVLKRNEVVCGKSSQAEIKSSEVEVAVRPEKVQILRPEEFGNVTDRNVVHGTVINKVYTGIGTNYHIGLLEGETVVVYVQNLGNNEPMCYAIGDKVLICWSPNNCSVFEKAESGGQ